MYETLETYIESSNKDRLYYRFIPASFISNFVPLLVILQDKDEEPIEYFEYKMWNILIPQKTSSNEDFSNREFLQELIQRFSQEYECEEHIYFYGNGTGGYEAILHGVLSNANAVFANTVPGSVAPDFIHLLKEKDSFPIFYLCNNIHDKEEGFIDKCKEYNIQVNIDFCSELEHPENTIKTLKKLLIMLERMT